jgi:cytochrome c biogenesis protein CcmG/thiol:disulfide interchange protein DsbE
MERTKTLLVILFVVAAFALLFLSVRHSTVADQSTPGLIAAADAKPAPDFTLPVVADGKPFQLQEAIKKQPVVLDFWATWCAPCRAELPSLEAVSRKYAGRVSVYGVNSNDTPAQISLFTKQNGLTFPMLSDTKSAVTFLYGADAIPLLVVVDEQGKVRSVVNGYDPSESVEATLSRTLDALLAEDKKRS